MKARDLKTRAVLPADGGACFGAAQEGKRECAPEAVGLQGVRRAQLVLRVHLHVDAAVLDRQRAHRHRARHPAGAHRACSGSHLPHHLGLRH